MRAINLAEDIKPVSEFRANTAAVLSQVRATGRPLVLTQNGRSAAVLLDVNAFEELRERLELFEEIRLAEDQIERGEGIAHETVKEMVLGSLDR